MMMVVCSGGLWFNDHQRYLKTTIQAIKIHVFQLLNSYRLTVITNFNTVTSRWPSKSTQTPHSPLIHVTAARELQNLKMSIYKAKTEAMKELSSKEKDKKKKLYVYTSTGLPRQLSNLYSPRPAKNHHPLHQNLPLKTTKNNNLFNPNRSTRFPIPPIHLPR